MPENHGGPEAEIAEQPPIELSPPDISRYRSGNTGIDYVTSFAAAAEGPHVMISALVHGNEICGAIALDHLLREGLRPDRGRLTLAFVNVEAYQRFDPAKPFASRYVDEDFNRLWSPATLEGSRRSRELARARALRPLVDRVDLLLDLHSMAHKTPPLAMAGVLAKGRELARALGTPAIVVADAGHTAGTRLRDYAGFGAPQSAKNALLIECGQHWEAAAGSIAIETALRFLGHSGVVDAAWCRRRLPSRPLPPQRVIEVTEAVTIETDDFAFAAAYQGMEVLAERGTVFARDGQRPIATPYDDCVLIMPTRSPKRGETAVRLGRYLA